MNEYTVRATLTIEGEDVASAIENYVAENDVTTAFEDITDERPVRYALVSVDVGRVEQIKAYMPGNYEVVGRTPIGGSNTVSVLIAGRDSCGWTLDDYVIPRLQSGMYYAVEIS